MSSEIYHRLQSTEPGFLKKDVYKRAEENNPATDCFASLSDAKLLELGISQLRSLPRRQNES